MSQHVIKCEGVSFAYEKELVLQNIDLTVGEGEFLGVIGPNGSGKSTLIKLILQLMKPQDGTIEVFGKPVHHLKDRSLIGYVSQKANSFQRGFPATVKEVVASGLYGKLGLLRWMKKEDWQKVEEAIEWVGLSSFADRNIGKLSGGQQQRAFIARALVSEPKLLILDEPTVGIDAKSSQQFYDFLVELHQQTELTLVLVTHDMHAAMTIVDQVACLNKRLVYHGSAKQLMAKEQEVLTQLFGDSLFSTQVKQLCPS